MLVNRRDTHQKKEKDTDDKINVHELSQRITNV